MMIDGHTKLKASTIMVFEKMGLSFYHRRQGLFIMWRTIAVQIVVTNRAF